MDVEKIPVDYPGLLITVILPKLIIMKNICVQFQIIMVMSSVDILFSASICFEANNYFR